MNHWDKQTLYRFLAAACLAGIAWLGLAGGLSAYGYQMPWTGCALKFLTDLPCPSCGSTRAALGLLAGDFSAPLKANPLGGLLLSGLVIVPLWMLYDRIAGRESLFMSVTGTLELLRTHRSLVVTGAMLVTLNWIWNISKGL